MFIQIHMLQSLPPGNLNRDENGMPKKCLFGGVTRGRISSQCLKRNIRWSREFTETFGESGLADRTRYLPKLVGEELKDTKGVPNDDIEKLMQVLGSYFGKESKSDTGMTGQSFLSTSLREENCGTYNRLEL